MKTIIAGIGKIGKTIVESLMPEGHDIVVIDDDERQVSEVVDSKDVMGICGNCGDCEILEEAGVRKADLFIAVTGSDELNMLSCFLAKKMGAKHTIARIRNPEYNDRSLVFMCQQLDLSMSINPDLMVAHELYDMLKMPVSAKIETFSKRKLELLELKLKAESMLDGYKLMDLREKLHAKLLVCGVQRGEDVFIPDGRFELKSGDKIWITASPNEMQKCLKNLALIGKQAKSVMVLGGSRIAHYLSQMLVESGSEVKIIEVDKNVCKSLSESLDGVTVINGDGAKQDVLFEEGLKSYDAFVALTGTDEENILVSFFAESQEIPKVIAKVDREEFASMADKLGLQFMVSPQKTVSNIIVQYARALHNSLGSNVETIYRIMDGKAELLEFLVRQDHRITDIPLKDLKFKENILIAGIVRNRRTIIPSGLDTIMAGDSVIVIAANHRLHDLADILA